MGYARNHVLTNSAVTVGVSKVLLGTIPPNVCEGSITVYNRGTTNLMVHVRNNIPTTRDFYWYLVPGAVGFEDGIIPGDVSALSDAAGGLIDFCSAFSVQNC